MAGREAETRRTPKPPPLKTIWPVPTLPDTGIAAANARLRSLLTRPQPPKDTP